MAKFVRYALATVCFAASVGCLALWWRSQSRIEQVGGTIGSGRFVYALTVRGVGVFSVRDIPGRPASIPWAIHSRTLDPTVPAKGFDSEFGADDHTAHFPLWYPASVFALASVGVIRFRRQFSIRSALIAFTVVAALLAMPVVL